MRLVLNKRFFIPILTTSFLALILLAPQFRSDAPTYAYLIDDWETLIGPGRLLNSRILNLSFHLVSFPDGNTVRRFYGVDTWVEDLIAAPNREMGIFRGASEGFPLLRALQDRQLVLRSQPPTKAEDWSDL